MIRNREDPRRRLHLQHFSEYLGVLGLLLILNLPTLARGFAPTEACGTDVPLFSGLVRFQNCDAPGFIAIAQDPSSLFSYPGSQTITRPLMPVIAFVINAFFETVTLGRFGLLQSSDNSTASEFGFLVVNFLLVSLAIWIAFRFFGFTRHQWPMGLFFLLLLAANPVTRAFLWTAHLQAFNLFMPILAASLGYLILQREDALPRYAAALIGFGFGLSLLAYGNMVVALGVITLCLVIRGWHINALILVCTSALVFALWAGIALITVGSFTSVEVRDFDQFVWIVELHESDNPLGIVVSKLGAWMISFTDSQTVFALMTLLLAFVLSFYSATFVNVNKVHVSVSRSQLQKKLTSILLTLTLTFVFYLAMGFYQTRLSWMLVTTLIVATGVVASYSIRNQASRSYVYVSTAFLMLAFSWYSYWILIPGPWS